MEPMTGNAGKLAGLLQDREGWRLEHDPEPHWCFGMDGAARLVITPEMDGFLMYRADQDRSWVIPRINSVEAWLNQNEHEHAGLTPLQMEIKGYLETRGADDAGSTGADI
jgi:hypothetical protein